MTEGGGSDGAIAGRDPAVALTQGKTGGVAAMVRRAFSVAVYARRGDRVLVIEHRRLRTWLPIGGELEAGETPLEAARRELREELPAGATALRGGGRAGSGST